MQKASNPKLMMIIMIDSVTLHELVRNEHEQERMNELMNEKLIEMEKVFFFC